MPPLPGVQVEQKRSRDVEGWQGLGKRRGPLHWRRESAPALLCGRRRNSSWASGLEPEAAWPAGTSKMLAQAEAAVHPTPAACPPHLAGPPRPGPQGLSPSALDGPAVPLWGWGSSHLPRTRVPQKARTEGSPETLPVIQIGKQRLQIQGRPMFVGNAKNF